jgi:Glucuronyl esterase, fungi/Secretion system C-terminal sorting domain
MRLVITKICSPFLSLLLICLVTQSKAQTPPLVYNLENTGANFPPPLLPTLSQLPIIEPLTDPFMWSDGSGRSLNFNDWKRRRNEIKKEIENYEIGTKPDRPTNITASYVPTNATTGTLTVIVTENGQSLTLTSQVSLPTGSGPFPAVIGMNSLSGSIPASVFTSRSIARIQYNHNQVTTYLNPQITNPYYRLYPDQNLNNAGQYSAWAWGVSRIIDGLELVQSSLPIDLSHLGVTGCSYAGKMALFAGAFDERIALTIAQESGGGGAPSWRVSHNIEPNGSVEKIDNTDYNWFREDMRQFSFDNVYKLPEDHHELMAMVAPRALLVTGNTDFVWLSNKSCYVSARAAKKVYETFGISDRMGFYIDGGHNHCAVPATQIPAIEAFVEKFLKGNTNANTNITVNPFPDIDYERWYKWWGTGSPVLPAEPIGLRMWMEAECATVGSNWQILPDVAASNGQYVVVNGLNSTVSAPAGAAASVVFSFNIDSAATYNLMTRLNCPTANDDSYWIKIDNGAFATVNNLTTSGWAWVKLATSNFSVGQHTITIAYREDGAKLDKLALTTTGTAINGTGTQGSNCSSGVPVITPNQIFPVSETFRNDSTFGTVLATDPDPGTEFQNWKIVGGSGAAAFAIDIVTGKLIMKDSSLLDFESAVRTYDLILTTTDGYHKSNPETITITLTNANDNIPALTAGLSFALDGGACSQLGNMIATDADNTNEPGFTTFQNWQITGGTGTGIFTISPTTGMISLANITTAELKNSSFTLSIIVSDGLYTSDPKVVTITIPDRIVVCHKGQLITVSKMAAIGHLQHGDCIGSCEPATIAGRSIPIEESTSGSVLVYPNPARGVVNVALGLNYQRITSIRMYDMAGKMVKQISVNGKSNLSITTDKLLPGIYLLKMQGDKVITEKVLIQ